jgi:hypothetical protein
MRRLVEICALYLMGCPGPDSSPGNETNSDNATTPRKKDGPQPPPAPKIFNSSDAVVEILQNRVTSKLGLAATEVDFQVRPVGVFVYPIGTLMPEGRTVAKNKSACAPPPDRIPSDYNMPNTFNTIAMTGKVAFELGLNEVISNLANAGVKVGQDDTFELSVTSAKGRFLLDDELDDILKLAACKAYLGGKTMNLVRGYVIGQRSYLLERSRTGSGGAGLTTVGEFKVQGSKGTKVSLIDEKPIEFLQIVSRVSLPAAGPGLTPTVSVPTAPAGKGKVYVQRDLVGTDADAIRVQKLLGGLSLEVVPKVELVESRKMPKGAQVRYFNKEDEVLADRTANALKEIFPGAAKLYVGLKAPPKQLEVWLPRVGR